MLTLRSIGKDRRCKLSDKSYPWIKFMYGKGYTMQEIGKTVGVTHQRISQIVDRYGTEKDRRKVDAQKFLQRYRTNKRFHAKMLLSKKECYRYKVKMITNYGK